MHQFRRRSGQIGTDATIFHDNKAQFSVDDGTFSLGCQQVVDPMPTLILKAAALEP